MADDLEEDNGKSSQQLLDELVLPKDDDDEEEDEDGTSNAFMNDTASSLGDGEFGGNGTSTPGGDYVVSLNDPSSAAQMNSLLSTSVGEGGNDGENINKDVEQEVDPNGWPNQAAANNANPANPILPPQFQPQQSQDQVSNPLISFAANAMSNPALLASNPALLANVLMLQQQLPQAPQNNVAASALSINPLLLFMAAQAQTTALLNPALLQNILLNPGIPAPQQSPANPTPVSGNAAIPMFHAPPQQEKEPQQEQPEEEEQRQPQQPDPPRAAQQEAEVQQQQQQQQQQQVQLSSQLELIRWLVQNGATGIMPVQNINPMMNMNVALGNTASPPAAMSAESMAFNNHMNNLQGIVLQSNPMAAFPMFQQFVPAVFAPQQQMPIPQQQQPSTLDQSHHVVAPTSALSISVHRSEQQDPHHGFAIPLYLDHDDNCLTPYQCFLRKQIELFEAGDDELQGTAQGRNTPLRRGQIGIRCRHCTHLPKSARSRGGVYYSKTIDGVYQVAQNMSKLHFLKSCSMIPESTRNQLRTFQCLSSRASGGKDYWAEGLRVLGVVEDERGFLKFESKKRGTEAKALSEVKAAVV